MRIRYLWIWSVCVGLLLWGARSARAFDEVVLPPVWQMDGLAIAYQRVDVELVDQVATTTIEMLFRNVGSEPVEGVYLFPLPPGSAVDELTMWVDGTAVTAKLLDAGEARAVYDAIVHQMRDPALLEYVGTDAIQANIFPIPPRGERRVVLRYQHLLTAEGGLVRYQLPQHSHIYTNRPLESQSIRVALRTSQPLRAVYSPTHAVSVTRDGDWRAVIGYEQANATAVEDFELFYSTAAEGVGVSLLSSKEPGEDGYFLLLAAPGIQPGEVVARDILLVLDTSGSMEGEKLAQAKQAARYVLTHLNAGDRFNLLAFSTGVRPLAERLQSAAAADQALPFVDRLEALGGTNIGQALLEALAQVDRERPTAVLFLTDGLATEGITETPLLIDAVRQAAPPNVRLFAFGVGDDVDTTLLDTLTTELRGLTTYVRPGEAIDEQVSSFYAKVSTPVLTDLTLSVDGVTIEQTYPSQLPDLFAGSQLIVAGRYRAGGGAIVTLRGEVNGREQMFRYDDLAFRETGGEPFVARLWATRAIGHLLQQIRLHGENTELIASVVALSRRYGIITPYTSFLIEEDDIFSAQSREEAVQAAVTAVYDVSAAPASGSAAVERAAEAFNYAQAEVVIEAERRPSDVAENSAIRYAGNKTFVQRNGIWIDTIYNPDAQALQVVPFAEEAYFALLDREPDLARYLAVGPRAIVVYGGVAYEVTSAEPDPALNQTPPSAPNATTRPNTIPLAEPTTDGRSSSGGGAAGGRICFGALLLLALPALIWQRRRMERR